MSKYIQKGEVIEVVATENIALGDIVSLGSCIGVAGNDAPNGQKYSLYLEGVFEMPKASGLAISIGDKVYYNTTNKNITKTESDVPAGICVKASETSDEVVSVKIG